MLSRLPVEVVAVFLLLILVLGSLIFCFFSLIHGLRYRYGSPSFVPSDRPQEEEQLFLQQNHHRQRLDGFYFE